MSKNIFNEKSPTSVGQIANLLSVDMARIDWFFFILLFPFPSFILLGYTIFKLWKYLHHYTLYGVLFLFAILVFQTAIGVAMGKINEKRAKHTDERIRLVDEFINAIKIIKIYCWEHPFAKKIKEARRKEIVKIRQSLYAYSLSFALMSSSIRITVYITLITFYYFSNSLITDTIVFLCLSTFNQVVYLVTEFIPQFVLATSSFNVTIKRINQFLSLEEKSVELEDKNDQIKKDKEYDLSIKNMTACFSVVEKNDDNVTFLDDKLSDSAKSNTKNAKLFDVLKNINFNCKQGELVIVIGAVGSGKSSLFQAFLSELKIRGGSIEVNGKLSYASQEPWIFGGTIRENILFDLDYDGEKYNEVIKVCALERDLKLFANGDESFIGERGIVLSGGQKARISLARSLYYDADIYLLDDPLSAVDSHVAKHLFKNAISDYLKNKTVILITHQLNYIQYADKILFIKEGEQLVFDQSENCLKKLINEPECEFTKFLSNNISIQNRKQKETINQDLFSKESSLSLKSLDSIFYDECEENQLKEIKKIEKERILQEEDDEVRFVYKSYLSYFRHGNILLFSSVIILGFGSAQFFGTLADYFLKIWSDYVKVSENSTNLNLTFKSNDNDFLRELITEHDVCVYSVLIVCYFGLSLIRNISHALLTMRASASIHESLFERIVRAKMRFFYDYPVGIILNRFSRDIGIVDEELYYAFYFFLDNLASDIAVFLIMIFLNPFLLLPISIFSIASLIFRTFYVNTARKLNTLEGLISFCFNH